MNTRFVSTLVAFAVLWGCAAEQPQLVTEPGVSLTGYRELEVAPVINDTGQTVDSNFIDTFAADLKAALRSKGYDIIDAKPAATDTLVVICTFLKNSPGGGVLNPEVSLQTTLLDKRSNKTLGAILTTVEGQSALGGVLFADPAGWCAGYDCLLGRVANQIAAEIDRKIKGP